jgi:hypothetical protein
MDCGGSMVSRFKGKRFSSSKQETGVITIDLIRGIILFCQTYGTA